MCFCLVARWSDFCEPVVPGMPQKEQGRRAAYISQQVNPREGQWRPFHLTSSQVPGLWLFHNGSPLLIQQPALFARSPVGDDITPETRDNAQAHPQFPNNLMTISNSLGDQGCEVGNCQAASMVTAILGWLLCLGFSECGS